MRKLLILLMAPLLVGCATLTEVGDTVCDREVESRIVLHAALERATEIDDDDRREIVLAAIRASLAILDECPDEG